MSDGGPHPDSHLPDNHLPDNHPTGGGPRPGPAGPEQIRHAQRHTRPAEEQPADVQRAEARPRLAGIPGLSRLGGLAGGLLGMNPTSVVRAVPDVAKVAGAVLWRTNQWTINISLHIGDVVLRGVASGQSAEVLVKQVGSEARRSLRELLDVGEAPDPMPKSLRERISPNGSPDQASSITLADRMNALLDASSDLTYADAGHPAYVRMLSELSPDEARILRLFAQRGAQPSVDVRTKRPFGAGSELVVPGITMIGRYAGCRDVERVPGYLNNLFRLGLIWFSHETLPDKSLYDVLEAQEEVEEAMKRAGKGVTVRRSIELTAFGRNLCSMTGLLPPSAAGARPSVGETSKQPPPPDAR